jgi:hypothetical protein
MASVFSRGRPGVYRWPAILFSLGGGPMTIRTCRRREMYRLRQVLVMEIAAGTDLEATVVLAEDRQLSIVELISFLTMVPM